MIYCMNHKRRDADYHCSHCEIGICKDCVNLRDWGATKLSVCPICGGQLVDLAPYKPIPPFWTQIPYFLSWPFSNMGWIMFIGWGIAALVLRGVASLAGCWGLILVEVYYGLLFSYFYRIISRAEDGKFELPPWAEFEDFGQMFSAIVHFLAATFAGFWPIGVWAILTYFFNSDNRESYQQAFTSPVGKLIIVLSFFYGLAVIPMAYLVIGTSRNLFLVMNPVFIFQQVRKITKEYMISLLIIVILLVVYLLIAVLLGLMLTAMGGGIIAGILRYMIDGALQLYLFMMLGHLLGYMAYQCRFKLKWWKDTQEEPTFMVGGKPARLDKKFAIIPRLSPAKSETAGPGRASAVVQSALGAAALATPAGTSPASAAPPTPGSFPSGAYQVIPPPGGEEEKEISSDLAGVERGMKNLELNRLEEAETDFRKVLAENPNQLGALRGMTMVAERKNNPAAVKEYGKREGEELVKNHSFDKLWERYGQIKKVAPDFVLNPKEQFVLCRYLYQQNLYMETARSLRELAVAYPADPLSPKALFLCGELLRMRCGKPENARQIYQYILKRYPASPLVEEVKKALAGLDSVG